MRKNGERTAVSPDQARELVAGGEATVLDIRKEEEFGSGHIAGAPRVDPDAIDSELAELEEGATIVVVCAEGKRSAEVAEDLRQRGYDAMSMEGGMAAWDGPTQPAESDFEFEGPGSTQPGV